MMTTEPTKPKKQKLNTRNWMDKFLGTWRIEFVSPYSLEHCAERLHQQHNTSLFAYPKVWVKLEPIDEDTYYLRFTQEYFRSGTKTVTGYLKRWEQTTTLINVAPERNQLLLVIFSIIVIAVCIWIASTVQNMSLFFLLAPILITFLWMIFRISIMEQWADLQYSLQKLLQVDPSN